MLKTLPNHSPGRLEAALGWWARAALATVFVIVVANWVGWATGIDRLTRFFPSWPPMTPWSALLVAGLAVAVLTQTGCPSRARVWVGCGLAAVVGAVAVVFLTEYATGGSFDFDQVLFSEAVRAAQPDLRGRPSPQTASSVLLLSLAVGLTRLDRRWTPIAWALSLVVATALPFFIVIGYVFESI